MKNQERWIDLAIINLCVVAFLGFILRSKMVFALPIIDYNLLLNTHSHFAFGGWVTLALMTLLVFELLPDVYSRKFIYKFILGGIVLSSWGIILSFPFEKYPLLSTFISTFFILVTYCFGWVFIKDILKTNVSKTVRLLSISSAVCLILSSIGPFTLSFLFATKSLNVILYKDALFTYLHLQYNGFFTLAVFALLFHKLEFKISLEAKKNIHLFSFLLTLSVLPSLFLSYLWSDPNLFFHIIASIGSILLLASLCWFIISARKLKEIYKSIKPIIRIVGTLFIGSFILKIFLQSFLIVDFLGDPIFGDRPAVMAFLHLVFLSFVSLFLLSYFAQTGLLNIKNMFTKFALIIFTIGVVINEILLWSQGVGAIFIKSSYLFPWMLWAISIWLCIGTIFILIARIRSKRG